MTKEDTIENLVSRLKCCFKNPHHYSLKEQENMVRQDAKAIKQHILSQLKEKEAYKYRHPDGQIADKYAIKFYNLAIENLKKILD